MALVVRLPLPIRHVCVTPDGGAVRALLLDDEAVVLTNTSWHGVHFRSLAMASRFVSGGKCYAGGRNFFFPLSAVSPEVVALLCPLVKGDPACFTECEIEALLMLAYQGRVVFDASIAAVEIPLLISPERVAVRPGRLSRGREKVLRLKREVRRPKAVLKSGHIGVTCPLVASRPDSTRGRKERKKALFRLCDDGTAYGVFVAMWFADESNWLPDSTPHREDVVMPPMLIEDTAALRKRIQSKWRSLSAPEKGMVEAEWLHRMMENCRHLGPSEMISRLQSCEASQEAKKLALQRWAKKRLKLALDSKVAEAAELAAWTRVIGNPPHLARSPV